MKQAGSRPVNRRTNAELPSAVEWPFGTYEGGVSAVERSVLEPELNTAVERRLFVVLNNEDSRRTVRLPIGSWPAARDLLSDERPEVNEGQNSISIGPVSGMILAPVLD